MKIISIILTLIFIYASCNPPEPKTVLPEIKDSTTRAAPASAISDVNIPNSPDVIVTKTKSGNTISFSLDVSSTNLGIPAINAEITKLKTEIANLKVALAKKDTVFYKGFKGSGTKLIPYEDIEP